MFGIPTPESLAAKALCAAAGAIALLSAGAYAGYRWELGAYQKHLAADAAALQAATAKAADTQHRIDLLNQADAVGAAYFRGKMDATTIQLVTGAPANVTILQDQQAAAADHAGCITFGFARLLYAGAHGVAPESISLPSGESVDTCTALEPSVLATQVAQDLAAGFSNGHQLDSVIAAVKRNAALAASR